MPRLRTTAVKEGPVAVLCSDIHLSLTAPAARSVEDNWLEAQAYPLKQLRQLAEGLGVPVICAGDIFHQWRSPPELVNFALKHLPDMYAVPGQHDLPWHHYEELRKSAFGTLVYTGKVKLLTPGEPVLDPTERVRMWGFPWGSKLEPPTSPKPVGAIDLAVVHAYIWRKGSSFPGASEEHHVQTFSRKLKGYDVAVFGDNHKAFLHEPSTGCVVFNHGALQRRAADEQSLKPAVGILMSNGEVRLHSLDCSSEKWVETVGDKFEEADTFTMQSFLRELGKLSNSDELSFAAATRHYLKTYEVSEGAQRIILESLENT